MHAPVVILLMVLCHITVSQTNSTVPRPQVYYLHVNSDIRLRYARTVVDSKIANPARISQEISFSAVLPETAFISAFAIEVDGKEYDAYVKEKEEARQVYAEAVSRGWTAGHVALSARDSNRFTVSVNVEPQKKIKFKLTYEELLSRKLGTYKHVINLDPGQIVPDLNVRVNIEESTDIALVKVPALRISNEITEDPDPESGWTNPLASIQRPTPKSAVVKFAPTPEQQRDLASDGIKGQLIVEYDVNRTAHPGDVVVRDGYFVHFFAPADLSPLRKHVTFVLDVSGSMNGRKVQQLRQAMATILGDLNRNDLFSIVLFSDTAQVWDPKLNRSELQRRLQKLQDHYSWGYPLHEHQDVQEDGIIPPTVIAQATLENINKAKEFIGQLEALSSTNMYDALMKALKIMNLGRELAEHSSETNEIHYQIQPEPIVIFLTDGQPNRDKNMITTEVTKANTGKYSILSLALGDDADLNFLKKLSLRNSGFARKIYEASDTALQLRDFYKEVSSPLLANITFKYEASEGQPEKVTKRKFRRLFFGSELVVAGKLQANNFTVKVEGSSSGGYTTYPFVPICPPTLPDYEIANHTPSSMERMWAYLTIQQLLEEDAAKDDRNQSSVEKDRALQLALQYSFVTPVTSLVVVKSNETTSVGTRDASLPQDGYSGNWNPPYPQPLVAGFRGPQMASASDYAARPFIARPLSLPSRYPPPPQAGSYGVGWRLGSSPSVGIPGTPSPPPPPPPGQPLIGIPGPPVGAPITLIPLSQISWLPAQLNSSNITLQLHNSVIELQVASDDQPNDPAYTCGNPEGLGECRHLRYCALDIFASNISEFAYYYCNIQSYVGVCCPLHLASNYAPRRNTFIARPLSMPSGYPLPPPGSYGVGWNPGSAPSIRIPGIAPPPPPPPGSYGVGWNPGSAPSIRIPGIAPPPPPPPGSYGVGWNPGNAPSIRIPGIAPQPLPYSYVPQAPITLIPLSQISWLPAQLNSSNITLQLYNYVIDLQVASDDQPNDPAYTCWSPAGMGECRHLRYCALDVFASNKSDFVHTYFCRIHNYVGVCCPLHLGQASSRSGAFSPPSTQRSLAVVPLNNITWYNLVTINNTMTLPSAFAGGPEQLRVSTENEPKNAYGTCINPAGLGFCRHFRHCTLQAFTNNITEFYPQYFCRISGVFVGVCCPLTVLW